MTDRTVCEHFNEIDKCDDCQKDKLERLRDEFAMAAMQALITHYGNEIPNGEGYKECAWESYKFADAMMKERSK